MAEPNHPYLGIHSVSIYVRDLERSLRFYVGTLGFHVVYDATVQSGERWIAVAPPDGGTVLSLFVPRPDSREVKLIGRATRVAFVTEDVAGMFREWTSRGVRFRQPPRLRRVKYAQPGEPQPETARPAAVWGGIFARFEDPDRNSFSLVSFDEVTRALESRRRAEQEKREAEHRAAQELEIARAVQARLFPQVLPDCQSLEYAGVCIQARQVGGDYYDFLNLGSDRLGLVVGDIAGKGMAAALLMANLQANLRSQYAMALDQPRLFLRSVNRLFYENTSVSAYATLFFADYDAQRCRLRYVNCGHLCGLLLRRDGTVERLEPTSTVLGLFEEWDCDVGCHEFWPGDTLAVYTDGVTEAFDENGEEFGEARLLTTLSRHRHLPAREMLDALIAEIRGFSRSEQHDDITAIVARCRDVPDGPDMLHNKES